MKFYVIENNLDGKTHVIKAASQEEAIKIAKSLLTEDAIQQELEAEKQATLKHQQTIQNSLDEAMKELEGHLEEYRALEKRERNIRNPPITNFWTAVFGVRVNEFALHNCLHDMAYQQRWIEIVQARIEKTKGLLADIHIPESLDMEDYDWNCLFEIDPEKDIQEVPSLEE